MTQATQIVHWSGKDIPMCDKHTAQAKTIGAHLGVPVSSTSLLAALLGGVEITEEQLTCKNCENEAKKHADRPTEL